MCKIQLAQNFPGIPQLRDGLWRYETAEIKRVKADLQQQVQVGCFEFGFYEVVNALHGIPWAFNEFDGLVHGLNIGNKKGIPFGDTF